MDVIWKHLSDNHPSCRRLSLYSQSDPGTGATFAVRCNSLVGVTSEENFLNDAMYLIEGVLPLNETLQTVEMEWSFLSHLGEDDRDSFVRGVASLKKLEEISIRGLMTEESRMRFRSLLQIPECAKGLKHLSVELDEVHVEDPAEMGLAALLFLRCEQLESFHVRGLMPAPDNGGLDFDCSILLSALGKLPELHTIHMSRNQENPKTVNTTALRDVCSLPALQSLSLMNMGLTDKHCKIFKRSLYASPYLHSLILVDNPLITEKGNKALLRLLEKNRSIYNSTFGTDSETIHRTAQLVHLHLNRCGRAKVQAPTSKPNWLSYVSRINETVPEELELDTLLIAVQENPEMILQHCVERDWARQAHQRTPELLPASDPVVAAPDTPLENENVVNPALLLAKKSELDQQMAAAVATKKLPTRKDIMMFNDWESVFPLLTSRDSLDSIMSPPQPFLPTQDQLVSVVPPQEQLVVVHVQPTYPLRVEQHGPREHAAEGPNHSADDVETSHQGEPPLSSDTFSALSPSVEADPTQALIMPGDDDSGVFRARREDDFDDEQDSAPPALLESSDHNNSRDDRLEDLSLSWDSVVGGWVEFERTTNVLLERFRDETCWAADVAPQRNPPTRPLRC